MSDSPVRCLHCRHPVTTISVPGVGTVWRHTDGFEQCPPTYASPDFTARTQP